MIDKSFFFLLKFWGPYTIRDNKEFCKNFKGVKSMKKGFTLIELLVVVLIIGILSSVALPMYQKSVNRARMTEGLQMGKAWGNAQRVYRLETGEYAEDLSVLSLQIPELRYYTISASGNAPGTIWFDSLGSHSSLYFSLKDDGTLYGSCYGYSCASFMPCGSSSCVM